MFFLKFKILTVPLPCQMKLMASDMKQKIVKTPEKLQVINSKTKNNYKYTELKHLFSRKNIYQTSKALITLLDSYPKMKLHVCKA